MLHVFSVMIPLILNYGLAVVFSSGFCKKKNAARYVVLRYSYNFLVLVFVTFHVVRYLRYSNRSLALCKASVF